jgi:hypothetical protein
VIEKPQGAQLADDWPGSHMPLAFLSFHARAAPPRHPHCYQPTLSRACCTPKASTLLSTLFSCT